MRHGGAVWRHQGGDPLGRFPPEVWRVLAKCHDVRNLGEYEGDLNIDARLVEDLITACKAVAATVEKLEIPKA